MSQLRTLIRHTKMGSPLNSFQFFDSHKNSQPRRRENAKVDAKKQNLEFLRVRLRAFVPSRFPLTRLGLCRDMFLASVFSLFLSTTIPAQTTAPTTQSEALVSLTFPENLELKALVDYVSKRLGINILYDEELAKKGNTVTIRSPNQMPASGLLDFLTGVLRMKGFVLLDGELPGWKRIVGVSSPAGRLQPTTVDVLKLKHAEVSRLAAQLKQLLGSASRTGDDAGGLELSADDRTNQLIAVGRRELVEQAMKLAKMIDVEIPATENPIRFYKLTNATAADVLDTIRELEGQPASARPRPDANRRTSVGTKGSATSTTAQPSQRATNSNAGSGFAYAQQPGVPPASTLVRTAQDAESRSVDLATPHVGSGTGAPRESAKSRSEAVTADTNTNTIIVMGGPEVQRMYEQLIHTLDKRRPQVLMEATVVTLDTTDDFRFGVEISAHSSIGTTKLLTFSQFGLSQVDPKTGRLAIQPGTGLNAAVIGSGVADVVLQALAANSHARVQSSPRVLVNDNATGILTSIAEQPFTSVNASTTVATTSFGGYADAGTTISLTPHISEGDYLQLEYSVELSSFNGTANTQTGSPPPRQTDKVESKVTIPDGSTIIVGGLKRKNAGRSLSTVPILGEIPILKYLFTNESRSDSTSTLFVFLRPTILRDDEFADLKDLSERDLHKAGVPGNLPHSEPLTMP